MRGDTSRELAPGVWVKQAPGCYGTSAYDNLLPGYRVFGADTLPDLMTLTFDLFTMISGHTWRVTWPNPPPNLKIV